MKPNGPHLELTDDANKKATTIVNEEGAHLLVGRLIRSVRYRPEFWDRGNLTPEKVKDLLDLSSGLYMEHLSLRRAVDGRLQDNLTAAIAGREKQPGGLNVAINPPPAAQPEAKGRRL